MAASPSLAHPPAARPAGSWRDAVPYVAPFAVFMLLLALQDRLKWLGSAEFPLRVALLTVTLAVFSRHVIDWRPRHPLLSILVGVAVFVLWVLPDQLFPGYRQHWLFTNSITGSVQSSIDAGLLLSPLVLVFRTVRAAVLVPVIEELFWRGWLLRWLVNPDFRAVPLGTFQPFAFWASAVLFATEHGAYWEVGLMAGVAYNALMVRTRSLADCILAHAVTNLALSLFVIATRQWTYWM